MSLAGEMGLTTAWLGPETCCEGHRELVTVVLQKPISPGHSCRVFGRMGLEWGNSHTWAFSASCHLPLISSSSLKLRQCFYFGSAVGCSPPKEATVAHLCSTRALLSCPATPLPAYSFHKAQWLFPAGSLCSAEPSSLPISSCFLTHPKAKGPRS